MWELDGFKDDPDGGLDERFIDLLMEVPIFYTYFGLAIPQTTN